jgi:hypothetical protein
MIMETWRQVWRDGIVPNVTTAGLEALKAALENDDPRLTQGSTTTPPPLLCVQDWPVECACGMAFLKWMGDEPDRDGKPLTTVGQVEEAFADLCYRCDVALGEPAGCRWFLNWFDDTPRDEMRRELLGEVMLALQNREPKEKLAEIFNVPGHELPAA